MAEWREWVVIANDMVVQRLSRRGVKSRFQERTRAQWGTLCLTGKQVHALFVLLCTYAKIMWCDASYPRTKGEIPTPGRRGATKGEELYSKYTEPTPDNNVVVRVVFNSIKLFKSFWRTHTSHHITSKRVSYTYGDYRLLDLFAMYV